MNSGKTTTTAIVETLVAEVRVLMVGSRQVTISVFNQLDEVDSNHIIPMGRVRISRNVCGQILVVGMNEAGVLVRSYAYPGYDHYESWAALPLIVLAGLR